MSNDQQQVGKEMKLPFQPVPRSKAKGGKVEKSLEDIRNTFGFIPEFVNFITDESISGAWAEAKNLYFNPNTALDLKLKNLISLGVAAQIPCELIGYFEYASSLNNGATAVEQAEAVNMAAITRHWSTVLNGSLMDRDKFRKEADKIMSHVKKMKEKSEGKLPPEEAFSVSFHSAKEAYKDIEETLGLVPQFFLLFPEEGIAGAWSEFKGLQLNPYTSLNGKQKELIGLAVASQIPCEYCIYFHRAASRLYGATDREIQEAISIAAMARHWSTLFHGMQLDLSSFRKDADRMVARFSGKH